MLDDVGDWYETLYDRDPETADAVTAAIDLLEERGPSLGRPLVDTIKGSSLSNLKELRPGSTGASEVRILFAFDPERQAVLLVAGDKAGRWNRWYRDNIPVAEARYSEWLAGEHDEER